ncbi:MAG: hypothetical protein L6282_01880 [Candidatus Methanoperedenaceae archaeon]|nr:hypothetical protein [Candidatus Methanoperedenaceae archaeon]
MKYETFERIMDEERIEYGIKDFKEYLKQYDFGSGKWADENDTCYVLEKLFTLLDKSRDLNNYGNVRGIIRSLIIDVVQQKVITADWIKPRMDRLKLVSYFEE